MYWESNQQQFKFSPCSGQKEKVEKKGGGQQSTNNIGAPQFFVRRWKEESPSQYAEIVIEPNIIALTKENLYQLGTQYLTCLLSMNLGVIPIVECTDTCSRKCLLLGSLEPAQKRHFLMQVPEIVWCVR